MRARARARVRARVTHLGAEGGAVGSATCTRGVAERAQEVARLELEVQTHRVALAARPAVARGEMHRAEGRVGERAARHCRFGATEVGRYLGEGEGEGAGEGEGEVAGSMLKERRRREAGGTPR